MYEPCCNSLWMTMIILQNREEVQVDGTGRWDLMSSSYKRFCAITTVPWCGCDILIYFENSQQPGEPRFSDLSHPLVNQCAYPYTQALRLDPKSASCSWHVCTPSGQRMCVTPNPPDGVLICAVLADTM